MSVIHPAPTGARTQRPPEGGVRYHGLDAARAGALILGIVLHSLLAYVPGFDWVVTDARTSAVAGALSFWVHMFRMPLFMLIAGFFAHLSLRRRGTLAFARDRAKRIALPLLVFMPIMTASMIAIGALTMARQGTNTPPAPPAGIPVWLLVLSPGHLWFLWTLLQLYVVVLAGRAIAHRIPGAAAVGARLGDLLTRPGGVLVAAVPYWIAVEVTGRIVGGPITLVPEWPSSVAFLGAFLTGWFVWARPGALDRLGRSWPYHVAIATAGTAALLVHLGVVVEMEATLSPWWARALLALTTWSWVYGLLGLCLRLLSGEHPAIRYVADSSYWLYLVHLPLVLLLQFWLLDAPLPGLAKAAAVAGTTVAVLLASYHLLVRPTWLGRWLNGRAHPRPQRRRG